MSVDYSLEVNCERCDAEIYSREYGNNQFELKRDGYDNDLCSDCVIEIRKNKFDKANLI